MSNRQIFNDFSLFSRALIGSKDVDPTYLVIRDIIEYYEFEPEWFAFMYVAFYSLESAIIICESMPSRDKWDEFKFRKIRETVTKFGHERRGTARNIDNQVIMLGEIVKFIDFFEEARFGAIECPLFDSNQDFRRELECLPMHGGWASFKIAEIFEKSIDSYGCLRVNDLGLEGRDPNSNDGPIGGLRWLYGRDSNYSNYFISHWNRFGINLAKAWNVDIGEIETCLCKFHKFASGKYFIGHDIQEFVELEELLGREMYENMMSKHFDEVFWKGKKHLEKSKKTAYRDGGKILYSKFAFEVEKDVLEILLDTE